MFFEVLAPFTQPLDFLTKPDEYRELPNLCAFVIFDPKRPRVKLYTRRETGWHIDDIIGIDSVVPLPSIDTELTFTEIYRSVPFDA